MACPSPENVSAAMLFAAGCEATHISHPFQPDPELI